METEPITRVVFRKWPAKDGGDVIALMPDLDHSDHLITSYQHIGQHGDADYRLVVQATTPATPAEYAPLLKELTQIGYRVRPIRRRSRRVRP